MDDDSLLKALKNKKRMEQEKRNERLLGTELPFDSNSRGNHAGGAGREVAANNPQPGVDKLGLKEAYAPITLSALEVKMPELKIPNVVETLHLTQKQKRNICTIAYTLDVHLHEPIEAPRIHQMWPYSPENASKEELNQAGPRPSENVITNWLGTGEFRDMMQVRGVEVTDTVGQLMPEQIALISILTDTSTKTTIGTRLKRAGIPWAKYHAWRRQKLFAEALQEAAGGALRDAVENTDVQLAQLAQNGDLNAIKYFNEMLGRGPNDRKAVDAMQFAKIILDVVQRHVNQDQARAIAAEIGLEAKKIGLS